LVGLGRIGSRVAALLTPWRVRIVAYDPYVPRDRFALLGVHSVDCQELLQQSDVVSYHVVLTDETRRMCGAEELALMKPSAVVINTSRGALVDEFALTEALEQQQITGAALDVFEDEPLAEESALRRLEQKVLLSPRMVASNLESGLKPGVGWATESVLQSLRGEVPDNVYNREVIPRWLDRFDGLSLLGTT